MRYIVGLVIGLFVMLAIVFSVYLFQVGKVISLDDTISVTIEDNIGTEGAVDVLFTAGVINSRSAFLAHAVLTGERTNIKSGTYQFSGEISMSDVLDEITEKRQQQDEVEITLLEGWTIDDIAEYLANAELVNYDTFIAVANTKNVEDIIPGTEYPFLQAKPNSAGLIGYLFPDTYRIFDGETEIGIIERLLNNFGTQYTEQMANDVIASGRTNYDTLILASIVEKEVQTPKDKAIVAGIFWKRLDQGMRIQSDATINYVTHKGTTTPSSTDLQVESAYNTYRNDGLPPTPIANPGLDSLTAAVYPEESSYYYFLTTPEGEVLYSQTYDQHLTKRAQYYD